MVVTIDLSEGRKPRANGPAWNSLPPKVEIIALDPGGRTGWSYMVTRPEALIDPTVKILDNLIMHTHGEVDCGGGENLGGQHGDGYNGENAGISDILWLLKENPGAFVVIEKFRLRQMRMDDTLLSPVRIGKVIEWWLYSQGRNYMYQEVSEALGTATDERLRVWKGRSCPNGLYYRDGLVHARDADRHAITWLRKCSQPGAVADGRRLTSWPHLFAAGRGYGKDVQPS